MAHVLHKTADPVDYRESVNTPDYPPDEWFIHPDISAVAQVPRHYWKRPLTDPVQPMTQAERDAVDAAAAAAQVAGFKAAAIDILTTDGPIHRAMQAASVVNMREVRGIKGNSPRPQTTLAELITEAVAAVNSEAHE